MLSAEMVHRRAELAEGCCDVLPRTLPFVGLLRHAPPTEETQDAGGDSKKPQAMAKLLRRSPYVGFHRHAPPSPSLAFRPPEEAPLVPEADFAELGEPSEEPEETQGLSEELWGLILANLADLEALCPLACAARGMRSKALLPGVWAGREVFVPPQAVARLAPRLGEWLTAWRLVSKLTIPHSRQLVAEVARLAPALPVSVAWRFSQHFKGPGVEVLDHGAAVRRVGDEDVVCIGDAPLAPAADGSCYLEVVLEEFGEDIGDGLNDFGIGVTTTEPDSLQEIMPVADECPHSWVLDFAETCVCLSVENNEEAKGRNTCFRSLRAGDRIGLRVAPRGSVFELFVNGLLKETFVPRPKRALPAGARLYPLVDLYGHAVQMRRTYADAPCV